MGQQDRKSRSQDDESKAKHNTPLYIEAVVQGDVRAMGEGGTERAVEEEQRAAAGHGPAGQERVQPP